MPCAVETKTIVFPYDKNETMRNRKNGGNLKEQSCTFSVASGSLVDTECSESISSSSDLRKLRLKGEENYYSPPSYSFPSFTSLRLNYLLVNLVIMLADGLQGT